MKRFPALPTALALVSALAACDSPAAPADRTIPTPAAPLSEATLLGHLGVLAHDSMAGRSAGSPEEAEAAGYLRDRLSSYGLASGSPGYVQQFPIGSGATSQNVLAVLPGHGRLAGQWIVVGAHYDHVGFTQVNPDSVVVYNGADDNASGTALVLEIARYLSDHVRGGNMTGLDRRSVLFQAFGAEELGLVGSAYFCSHPTMSMDSIAAMVNFDMVGRLARNGLWVIGSSSSPDWAPMLAGAGVGTLPVTYEDRNLLSRSDQSCFLAAERPVLFLHTGVHPEYHSPFDDVALIDVGGMVTVGDLAREVLLELMTRPAPPTFTAP